MLHMNPREDGITFTHDSVASCPGHIGYEYIEARISSIQARAHTYAHNRAGMLHKRTRVKPRFLRAWYANPRSWNVEVPSDYTSDSHMRAISLRKVQVKRDRNDFSLTFRKVTESKRRKESGEKGGIDMKRRNVRTDEICKNVKGFKLKILTLRSLQ